MAAHKGLLLALLLGLLCCLPAVQPQDAPVSNHEVQQAPAAELINGIDDVAPEGGGAACGCVVAGTCHALARASMRPGSCAWLQLHLSCPGPQATALRR